MTGVARNPISTLLIEVGAVCADYQDRTFVNLNCRRLERDEIWAYCYAKDKNVPIDKRDVFGYGNVWTWIAIDADTKLVPCWLVGSRDSVAARMFIGDLASRLANCVQLSTDGYKPYVDAVENAFGNEIDYAMLVKLYGEAANVEKRYSPAECIGARKEIISGRPNPRHISTSYAESQNLTMRMCMRRFTRLTNAFSKDLDHHVAAIALHYMYYNLARIHQTLRVTPAMAGGVSDHVWEIADIVKLLEEREAKEQTPLDRSYNQFGPALGHEL